MNEQMDTTKHRHARFEPVFDSRKRKVRGLWKRGARYYAQLRVDLGNGTTAPRRFPLEAQTLDQARAEAEQKRVDRKNEKLRLPGLRPTFEQLADEYTQSEIHLRKKPSTQRSERQGIQRWKAHLGGIRVDKIGASFIHSYRDKRLQRKSRKRPFAKLSERTVNLDVIALRHVLRFAQERGFVHELPKVRALKQRPAPRRPLLTKTEFQKLLANANEQTTKNAEVFRFYLRFLALTGTREKEALHVARRDVDFARGTVTIGAGGVAKSSKERAVDFSPELGALLKEIEAWLPPDTSWLFPSPQRGDRDIHSQTLRESLKAVREKAKLDWIGFHDLRHFFASQCVMAGIDFMTIAHWLGHSDGGILVGKIYGHLADTHKRAAARKLRFFN